VDLLVKAETIRILASFEVADKLAVAFLPAIPLFASVGGAGGGFIGFLSQLRGSSLALRHQLSVLRR
jgi:hypothetical protein